MKITVNPLLYILFFSLPFTYAMTLKLGVNFKIYEIIIFILLGLFIRNSFENGLQYKKKYKNLYIAFLFFFLFYLLSNIYAMYDYSLISHDYIWSTGRFKPYINSIFPIIYLFITIFAFFFILERMSEELLYRFIRFWLWGAFISCLYLIYLNISIYTPLPEIKLPGVESIRYSGFGSLIFAREGTFREGGFLSGYIVASIILVHILYIKTAKIKYILFFCYLVFSLFLTVSTNGLASLFIYFNLYYILFIIYFKKISALRNYLFFYLILSLGIYFSPLFDFLYDIVYLKLFSENIDISPMAYSKFDRLYHLEKGLDLFKENIYFGIGSYNFGYYFPLITDSNIFADGTEYKKIINNVYVQILAENGIFAFLSFLIIPLMIIVKFLIKKDKTIIDLISISFFIVILIKWNAYPTYLLFYDWVAICLIVFVIWRKNDLCKC